MQTVPLNGNSKTLLEKWYQVGDHSSIFLSQEWAGLQVKYYREVTDCLWPQLGWIILKLEYMVSERWFRAFPETRAEIIARLTGKHFLSLRAWHLVSLLPVENILYYYMELFTTLCSCEFIVFFISNDNNGNIFYSKFLCKN